MKSFRRRRRERQDAVPMLPPICTSFPAWRSRWRDQRRRGRLAVGAGDGDEGRILARGRRPLAAEQLNVADHLDAGVFRQHRRPVRLGMRERHARRKHQRGDVGTSRSAAAGLRGDAGRRGPCRCWPALSSQAMTSAPPAARACALRQPRAAEPEQGDGLCRPSTVTGVIEPAVRSRAIRAAFGGRMGEVPVCVGAYRRAAARRASAGQANCSRSPAGRTKVRL